MAEPLGLEMDANPVTKGAGLTAESEQNIRHTETEARVSSQVSC